MDETYKLKDLLIFWQGQEELNFKGIKLLLEIFEDENIAEERARWIIIAELRELDLFESDYKEPTLEELLREEVDNIDEEDKGKKDVKKKDMSSGINWGNKKSTVGIDNYKCKILNGTIKFWRIMN